MDLEKMVLDFLNLVGSINFFTFGTLVVFLLIVFWLVTVGWVWMDSGERTSNNSVRVAYVLLTLILNIPGLIIYLIIRPSETIEEIYWADLERRYIKYETAELGDCPKCGSQLYPGYVFCSNCGFEIKKKCSECGVMVNRDSKYCYHCGNQLALRASKEEAYPNVEVMEQQILASKQEAKDTVEANRVRYKSGKSVVIKIGDSLIQVWNSLVSSVKKIDIKKFSKREEEKVVSKEVSTNVPVKKSKKKKKKNKRK